MSNFICCECGIAQIDCGGDGYKTPKEIELEKKLDIATKALEEYATNEQKFIKLLEFGETTRSARRKAKVSNNVVENIRKKLKKKKF